MSRKDSDGEISVERRKGRKNGGRREDGEMKGRMEG